MFTCTTCMLQFDLRTVYNTHIRKCISISNFATHTGQHVTATRNKEGVFLCYCSHSDYPKPTGYSTTNNLRKPMKKVQSTWIGPNNNKQSAQLKVKLCMIPMSMTCNWFWMIQFSRYVLFTQSLDIAMQSSPQPAIHIPISPMPAHVSPCKLAHIYLILHWEFQNVDMQSAGTISLKFLLLPPLNWQ